MEISTPCRIAIPPNFILKLGTRDYVRDIISHANYGVDQLGGGLFPSRVREI